MNIIFTRGASMYHSSSCTSLAREDRDEEDLIVVPVRTSVRGQQYRGRQCCEWRVAPLYGPKFITDFSYKSFSFGLDDSEEFYSAYSNYNPTLKYACLVNKYMYSRYSKYYDHILYRAHHGRCCVVTGKSRSPAKRRK